MFLVSASRLPQRVRVHLLRSVSSASTPLLPSPASPPLDVLDAIARSTPGTQAFGTAPYGANTANPYPIYWFDPDGVPYRFVLGVATRAADAIAAVHDAAALPWWATIVAVGGLIRFALLPINIASLRNAARMADAKGDIVALRRAYARVSAAAAGARPSLTERIALMTTLQQGVRAALHKVNCYPWRSLAAPLVQVPFVFAAVLGARHSVLLGDESFEKGGILWFTDLTAPDPFYILPMASIALAYASLEVVFRDRPKAGGSTARAGSGGALVLGENVGAAFKGTLQTWMILTLPFTVEFPAGLYILMASSSTWTIAFVTLMRHPKMFKALTGRDPVVDDAPPAEPAPPPSSPSATRDLLQLPSPPPSKSMPANATPSHSMAAQSSTAAARASGAPPQSLSVHAVHADVEHNGPYSSTSDTNLRPPLIVEAPVPSSTAGVGGDAASTDTAAFLQRLPRFLYYHARDINLTNERRHLLTISRTLNNNFPLLTGTPNALELQIAGGMASAPWSQRLQEAAVKTVKAAGAAASAGAEKVSRPMSSGDAMEPSPRLPLSGADADAFRASLVSAAVVDSSFEGLLFGSTEIVLLQLIRAGVILQTRFFIAKPFTGVDSSFEVPDIAPKYRDRAQSLSLPSAAAFETPSQTTLLSSTVDFAHRRARELVSALATSGADDPATGSWTPLRSRRKRAHALDALRAVVGAAPRRQLGQRDYLRRGVWRHAGVPASRSPKSGENSLKAALLLLMDDRKVSTAEARGRFARRVLDGIGASSVDEAGGDGITSRDLVFMPVIAVKSSQLAGNEAAAPLSPYEALAAEAASFAALTTPRSLSPPAKSWSGEQRAEFDRILRFSRADELDQATFLPRLFVVVEGEGSDASEAIAADFLARVQHAVGRKE